MDRIDLHLEVPPVPYKDLSAGNDGASSRQMMERVMKARDIQGRRFRGTEIHTNARMNNRQIKRFCKVDSESSILIEAAMEKFGLSARAYARILKIARTIADLETAPDLKATHVAEAIQYRALDRKLLT